MWGARVQGPRRATRRPASPLARTPDRRPHTGLGRHPMTKAAYRGRLRKDGGVWEVVMCEEEGKFRVGNTFNRESDAWQWITEQERAREICARLERGGPAKR